MYSFIAVLRLVPAKQLVFFSLFSRLRSQLVLALFRRMLVLATDAAAKLIPLL